MKKANRRDFVKGAAIAAVAASCFSRGAMKAHAQENPKVAAKGKEFKPGDRVESSGIYEVLHDRLDGEIHAHPHHVTVIAGSVFPHCNGCREWVKFRLHQEAEYIKQNPHFKS